MDDLFSAEGLKSAPLPERVRPRSIDEIIGHQNVLKEGSPLRNVLSGKGGSNSIILYGPPGTGKTTLALLAANSGEFIELSATSSGVSDVRGAIERGRVNRDMYNKRTVLFIDEIHRFSKTQQDSLLSAVERGLVLLIAASTENPYFSIISPLLSRSLVIRLEPLSDKDIDKVIDKGLYDSRGLNGLFTIDDGARALLCRYAQGDARRALVALEIVSGVARSDGSAVITEEYIRDAINVSVSAYDKDGDQHYDVLSAFIKSMRGGDADAVLHYLARMLVSGEDPVVIARRIVIAAAEDVGLANSSSLVVASAALDAVKSIGMPESRLILAEAALVVTLSDKSNSLSLGIERAIESFKKGVYGRVPLNLRDSHYSGADSLGHGKGYLYPHDFKNGVVAQRYIPEGLEQERYYIANERDGVYGARWNALREFIRGSDSKDNE